MNTSAIHALLAAALFGASTPFAKALVGDISPVLLAGLLYLGSGVGLGIVRWIRDRGWQSPDLQPREWPWLLGAIGFGGVLGPVALMFGLTHTTGAAASLLLNLEAVLTAVLAWVVFKENADRRIVLGMAVIVTGGVLLAWPSGNVGATTWLGSVAIIGACLCWAIDNNLTRKVSASDALFIASSKGLVAGAVNVALAVMLGARFPSTGAIASAMLLGLLGYGLSLVMFVLALRGLGSSRTGAYFSTAPFIGAALAVLVFQEQTDGLFWLAAGLMGLGVWLHLTERHAHEHMHDPREHSHRHVHDEHHQHEHEEGEDGRGPHTHSHHHAQMTHSHPHFPDIHHRHSH
ncbi:membrane protein [Hylemonella gracilis str. Niagara R]|uniref:Membrane protein n=1 Tax=Hylemonella gracilis str. Niagara R TaxID=1458275 RepID=A0A016XE37_9BURK|nr:DMT family transporter [Hylemonella gracilis]EYC50046.1 membrane protein [Hylemonella gracilis str. Niagara R]